MKKDPLHILVADDDEQFSSLICQLLQSDEENEYQFTFCHTGKQAVLSCRQHSFDCVLAEYKMPDMTGAELIQQIRQVLDEKTPPVVILAANRVRDAAIQSVRVQATDFLAKSDITQTSLARSVRNAVDKGRLTRGLQERRRELTLANLELERQAIEIQRFYHTVSHEMKTPLSATREFVSIVHDEVLGPVNKEQQEVLEHAMSCCDQITTQFNDLIDLTRLETGKLALNMVPCDLELVLKRVVAMVASSANEKSLSLEVRLPEDLPHVLMDEGRVGQVVSNLIGNAIKFTDAGGIVRVAARLLSSGKVQIRVSDTGQGIPKAYLADVFDRLFQVESARSRDSQSGLGLGLSVAREIIRGHGQEMQVRSRLQSGSLFTFELDVVDDATLQELAA